MIALPYFFKSRGRWGFPLKPQKAPFCTPSHFRLISVVPSPKGQFSKLQGWLLVKLFLQSKNKFIKSLRKSQVHQVLEKICEGLHLKRTISSKGEVRPSTIIIIIIIIVVRETKIENLMDNNLNDFF